MPGACTYKATAQAFLSFKNEFEIHDTNNVMLKKRCCILIILLATQSFGVLNVKIELLQISVLAKTSHSGAGLLKAIVQNRYRSSYTRQNGGEEIREYKWMTLRCRSACSDNACQWHLSGMYLYFR